MKAGLILVCAAACGTVEPVVETDAAWSVDHQTTDGVLLGVWGSRPDDVWAVGGQVDRSMVMHNDGKRWSPFDVFGGSLLYSVYGFSDSDIYAVGANGTIQHFDGAAWTQVASGTSRTLFGLWGYSGDDVWIVGGDEASPAGSAVVLRGSHGSFAPVELPPGLAPSALFKVHGFAPDDVMVVGAGGTVLRWNGTAWRRDEVPVTSPLFSTWGRAADDVFAVGGSGTGEILHYDGVRWTQVVDAPTGWGLSGVFTSNDGPTIAVGPQAMVFELDRGGAPVQVAAPKLDPQPYLHAVWGDEHGTTYAVGGDLFAYPRAMAGVILSRR